MNSLPCTPRILSASFLPTSSGKQSKRNNSPILEFQDSTCSNSYSSRQSSPTLTRRHSYEDLSIQSRPTGIEDESTESRPLNFTSKVEGSLDESIQPVSESTRRSGKVSPQKEKNPNATASMSHLARFISNGGTLYPKTSYSKESKYANSRSTSQNSRKLTSRSLALNRSGTINSREEVESNPARNQYIHVRMGDGSPQKYNPYPQNQSSSTGNFRSCPPQDSYNPYSNSFIPYLNNNQIDYNTPYYSGNYETQNPYAFNDQIPVEYVSHSHQQQQQQQQPYPYSEPYTPYIESYNTYPPQLPLQSYPGFLDFGNHQRFPSLSNSLESNNTLSPTFPPTPSSLPYNSPYIQPQFSSQQGHPYIYSSPSSGSNPNSSLSQTQSNQFQSHNYQYSPTFVPIPIPSLPYSISSSKSAVLKKPTTMMKKVRNQVATKLTMSKVDSFSQATSSKGVIQDLSNSPANETSEDTEFEEGDSIEICTEKISKCDSDSSDIASHSGTSVSPSTSPSSTHDRMSTSSEEYWASKGEAQASDRLDGTTTTSNIQTGTPALSISAPSTCTTPSPPTFSATISTNIIRNKKKNKATTLSAHSSPYFQQGQRERRQYQQQQQKKQQEQQQQQQLNYSVLYQHPGGYHPPTTPNTSNSLGMTMGLSAGTSMMIPFPPPPFQMTFPPQQFQQQQQHMEYVDYNSSIYSNTPLPFLAHPSNLSTNYFGFSTGDNNSIGNRNRNVSGSGGGNRTTADMIKLDRGEVIRRRGIVKFFDLAKGFGFILDDEIGDLAGKDIFVHYTAILMKSGFRCLATNEPVEYDTIKASGGGYQALNVSGARGIPLKGLTEAQFPEAELAARRARELLMEREEREEGCVQAGGGDVDEQVELGIEEEVGEKILGAANEEIIEGKEGENQEDSNTSSDTSGSYDNSDETDSYTEEIIIFCNKNNTSVTQQQSKLIENSKKSWSSSKLSPQSDCYIPVTLKGGVEGGK